jgi:type II secretory pathway pseudopilin PulG
MAREEGFTLIEVLIGAAISVVVIVTLTLLGNRLVFAATSLNTRLQTQTDADHVLDRLTSDAASSWAVWVPPSNPNEVDFFSEDGSHRVYSWAYTYDAQTKHLTRSGEDLGPFDSFSATGVGAAQLGSVDSLFAQSTIANVTYGYDAMPGATGGNGLVKITLGAAGANRSELLASGTSPTTFTVVVSYTPPPLPVATSTPSPLTLATP